MPPPTTLARISLALARAVDDDLSVAPRAIVLHSSADGAFGP